ncbi:hypothetical protein VN97_g690 [Penicillium thymicola]|uniref:Peptidase M24 domain-containing protein n=1 Tax=Penicillium thymicola TaxID=293382 RepID=A0AAI9XDD3_PENTH|nr:hypothetical protein VN97_g690 [Penicillium thymicola]
MSFDPTYDSLLAAVKDATNTGIKTAGVDVRISDVSAAIQEAMESYEVDINGHTFPVKAVRNITGHNIEQYRIHAGKSIPFVKNNDNTKMEAGEIFAIETFGTTGRGYLFDGPGVYGYGKDPSAPKRITSHLASAKTLYQKINENFSSLVFCRRYLERLGVERYLAGMNNLVSNGYVEVYQPLMDVKGSYSAQFEHTILLRESYKEVISLIDVYIYGPSPHRGFRHSTCMSRNHFADDPKPLNVHDPTKLLTPLLAWVQIRKHRDHGSAVAPVVPEKSNVMKSLANAATVLDYDWSVLATQRR